MKARPFELNGRAFIPHPSALIPHLMLTFFIVAASLLVVIALAGLGVAAASRHKKGARGSLDLMGRAGVVEKELRPEGAVMVGGEVWPARSRGGRPVARRARVRVVGARGHLLLVEPEE